MSTYDDIERDGYALIRNVFTAEEIARLRKAVGAAVDRSDRLHPCNPTLTPTQHIAVGDLFAYPELKPFSYVLLHERLLAVVRSVLGERVVYFGDSSMQTGSGPRGFHKDSVHRSDPTGSDWTSRYDVIRFGVYLQDHSRHSVGLKVRVGSHCHASDVEGKAVNIPSTDGDLVIWKLTTSHSGNVVRPLLLPKLCLHPGVETRLPIYMRTPEAAVRMSLFGAFGAPGKHLDTYLAYIAARKDFEQHYAYSTFTDEVRQLAAVRGVDLRIPMASFGSRVQTAVARE